jgi:hypothetical protein
MIKSSNIQAPEKFQISNINTLETWRNDALVWDLKFGASLELGAWDLEVICAWSLDVGASIATRSLTGAFRL